MSRNSMSGRRKKQMSRTLNNTEWHRQFRFYMGRELKSQLKDKEEKRKSHLRNDLIVNKEDI